MSFVLEALRRANSEQASLLLADDPEPAPVARIRPRRWAPALLALAAVLAGLGVAGALRRDEAPDASSGRVAAEPLAPSEVPAPGPERADVDLPEAQPAATGGTAAVAPAARRPRAQPAFPGNAAATQEAVRALYERRELAAPRVAEGADAAAGMPGAGEEPLLSVAPDGSRSPGVASPSPARPASQQTLETPVDVASVLERARSELGRSALSDHPAPLLETLSQREKDGVPTILYLRHEYDARRGGLVVLNGAPRRSGDRFDGLSVEEILSDSVVLRQGGLVFRLRALSSWVNL